MVQTALPSATVSNDWTVTGSLPSALQTKDGDTSKIDTAVANDICIVNIDSMTDPVISTGHILHFNAQAAGGGAPERIEIKLFEGATERAASGNIAITRSSYNDYSYTLSAGEADSITDYTTLRISIESTVMGGGDALDVSYTAFEIPDASTGFPHSQGYVIG